MNGKSVCDPAQVMDAVHGVTTEEVQRALQHNEWNPGRAERQLKVGLAKIHTKKVDNCESAVTSAVYV